MQKEATIKNNIRGALIPAKKFVYHDDSNTTPVGFRGIVLIMVTHFVQSWYRLLLSIDYGLNSQASV